MSTLILTGSDSTMLDVLDLTNPSKIKYCNKHNYDFLSMRSFSDDPQFGFESKHVGFLRALQAFKLIRLYDNVMWIDGDSIITNYEYTIEDFIKGDETFIASYDWMWHMTFSTGNFIIRRTSDVDALFNAFIHVARIHIDSGNAEQGALNYIHQSPDYARMFSILPHKYLNAVPDFMVNTKTWIADNNRSGIVSPWNDESFLAHLTGASVEDRVDILTNNKLGLNYEFIN